ncbi:MAG: gamma-glutamyl-gamma-aminobutyrate hydrolase family protein [Paludibacteraceae bacterium]|nr:gamma-glutamyl-gamma-aminobutyrate hydrolase family protein [Paludibacteraceae bacterium]MBR5824103.1 gamma-glutamyl-gamma-aminobutyrate hydrolase family protein [Paludibacteraceae bacterium]
MNYELKIGVSSGWWEEAHRLVPAYVQCIIDAGATPVVFPVTDNEQILNNLLDMVDGLLLTGGGDIDPKYWGEELMPQSGKPCALRDEFDLALVRLARQRCMPVLGICRGMQAMNIEFGGDIYQDIYTQIESELLPHSQGDQPRSEVAHEVELAPGSLIAKVMGKQVVGVNTFHHQSLRKIAPSCRAVGFALDSIVEAIEVPGYKMIGVQWHPENLYKEHPEQKALFDWLMAEAEIYGHARRLHRELPVVDTHTDTPMVWTDTTDLGVRQNSEDVKVDFVKMQDGDVALTFMVAYLPQVALDDVDYKQKAKEAHDVAVDTFVRLLEQVNKYPEKVQFNTQLAEFKPQSVNVCFGLENGFALAGDIRNVEKFYDMGVRYITLCHNGDNDLCDSARGNNTHGGLSDFGREVIREMNRLGMMVDVSHAADSTIEQAIEYSTQPIIATHTSAKALCDHPRNMSDELIVKLANSGGRIHVCLYNYFLAKDGRADINTICNHIDHIVRLVGSEHVGVGSDFDGGGGVVGCNDSSELINITMELIRRGYSDEDIKNIMGKGFVNYYSKI